jgi:hypothetical protein
MATTRKKTETQVVVADEALRYEAYLEDQMGHLHNRFVAFISESRLPLPQALLVIKMLEAEIMEQASKKYLGA